MDTTALFSIRDLLIAAPTKAERYEILANRINMTPLYMRGDESAKKIEQLNNFDAYICRSLVAIGQEHIIEVLFGENRTFEHLRELETFFFPAGGIVGYQALVCELIGNKKEKPLELLQPQGFDIREKDFVKEGVESLNELAFICPVGGAGDRFGLVDPESGEPWPLARLQFLGKPLLERLIGDIVALERLYYERMGKEIWIPIGLMTSDEKNNDTHVHAILKESNFFGKPRTSFFLFKQPLVPLFDKAGKWVCDDDVHFKPGGHGMLWRAAKLSGFFESCKKKYLLIRQINNPVAGIDHGLISFLGVGASKNKHFGFASCPRLIDAAEGMDVIKKEGLRYTLTNIEYTDFEKHGLEDRPKEEGSEYSAFPSNTNILFAKTEAVEKASERLPLPGPVINFKKGERARLELMMQNIADVMGEEFSRPIRDDELSRLGTYLTYNERIRTISVTKKQWEEGAKVAETPVGALVDWLRVMRELLLSCGFEVPEGDIPFIFDYHPALGPLFSQIRSKLRGGSLSEGSELILDIADCQIENIHVEGSCIIHSDLRGRCLMKNVRVVNQGIDTGDLKEVAITKAGHREKLEIFIEGDGSFIAEDVVIEGGQTIRVQAGTSYRF